MLKVAVVGATGYTGEELVDLLLKNPEVKITSLTAKIDKPEKFTRIFRRFTGRIDLICRELDIDAVCKAADLVFLALPHCVSLEVAGEFLKAGKKVIDLSADYRLKDTTLYEKWYGRRHNDAKNLAQAVYGMPELYKKEIKGADLVANPGCYPTSIILAAAPLVKKGLVKANEIIVSSLTGVSGAGRKAALELHFSEIAGNVKPYKVNNHQHMPEIEQELSQLAGKKVKISFIPQLIPINRGILSILCFKLAKVLSAEKLHALYKEFYKKEPFVRILEKDEFPQIKYVAGTNFCDIGLGIDGKKGEVIAISAIDNLLKGASGQAVQNMNIMYGFKETAGLQ